MSEDRHRVLVVDDEELLAVTIEENLTAEGYAVSVVHDGAAALSTLAEQEFDLVLLDVMMPEVDGFSVCRALRERGDEVPVMFLTARGDLTDRVEGLEAGGDDYLPKPFALKELLLRVSAILRRRSWYTGGDQQTFAFGGHTIDLAAYRAHTTDGAEHRLSHKEAMIFKCLWDRADKVVSRDDILELVWGYEVYPSTRTVDNFILRLRKLFEPEPDRSRHIHTVRGVGYRFTKQPEETP